MKDINLELWIKRCEGLNLETYIDTKGHLTIGWGHNLDNGITADIAEYIFQSDLQYTKGELEAKSWFVNQPENVKKALINMNFNLGIRKLLTFKKMIAALITQDYTLAAQEALNSLWAIQVGDRAKDVALMIRQG